MQIDEVHKNNAQLPKEIQTKPKTCAAGDLRKKRINKKEEISETRHQSTSKQSTNMTNLYSQQPSVMQQKRQSNFIKPYQSLRDQGKLINAKDEYTPHFQTQKISIAEEFNGSSLKNIRNAPPLRSNFHYNQRKKSNQPPKAAYMLGHAPKSKKLLEPISETIKKHKASKSMYQSFGNPKISHIKA